MLLTRLKSFLFVVVAAVLVCQSYSPEALAQSFAANSGTTSKSSIPATVLFHPHGQVQSRPSTPGEQVLNSARKASKARGRLTGLSSSSTQVFQAAITTASGGQETNGGASGDLNGDGKLDLVLASQCATNNCSNGVISVLLGNGDGTYQAAVIYPVTGQSTQFVALSDVNGDGKLDIVAASYCNSDCSSGVVDVLLGNGDGTFQTAVGYSTGGVDAKALAVGDANGDGKADLLVINYCASNSNCSDGIFSILLGNGDGTFQPVAATYSTGAQSPQSIAAADLSGDGKVDVIIANECASNSDCSSGYASVLVGNGDGTFQNATNFASGAVYASSLAVGDVNGDNHPDILVGHRCNDSSNCSNGAIGVLLGNGDGTFQTAVQYGSGGLYAQSVALGDFNADGKLDLAVSNQCQSNSNCQYGNSASILLGNGDGTFKSASSYFSGSSSNFDFEIPDNTTVLVGDVNGDGKADVLVTNSCSAGQSFACYSGAVNVLLGSGDGTLQAGVDYQPAGWSAFGIASADVNGDGKPDILVAEECTSSSDCNSGEVSVLLSNGDGTFQTGGSFPTGGLYALWLASADLNGDGKTDVVVSNQCGSATNCSNGVVSVLLGNGDGTFQSPVTYSINNDGERVLLADLNGDGKLDIILAAQCGDANCDTGAVNVLLGNGDGTFQPQVSYSSGGAYALGAAVGDINGDGKPDVVVTNECVSNSNCTGGIISVLLGNGDGTLQPAVIYNSGGSESFDVQLGDMNGDGMLDAVVESQCGSSCANGGISVLLGNGNGTFQTATTTDLNQSMGWHSIVLGDFNGDHKLDVASGTSNTLLLGNGDGTFQPPMSLGGEGVDIVSADFNGDGRPDLAVGGVTILLNISSGFVIPTSATVNASPNPSSYGQSVTFTATITPQVTGNPTGTVTFSDGSTQLDQVSLLQGTATYSTSALSIGSHSITASYSGDPNYGSSISTAVSQIVGNTATTTALTASPNPSNSGQSVTFTATVTSATSGTPTGTVNFFDGSSSVGSSTLTAGVTTYSTSALAIGSHAVTAVYSGDGDYNGSTSGTVNEVVAVAGYTLSSTALTPVIVAAGGSAQWTIAVNPTGGFDPSKVALSCAVTPAVSMPVACSLGSISISGGIGTAILHVSSSGSQIAAVQMPEFRQSTSGKLFLFALFIPGMLLTGPGKNKSNRGKLVGCVIALIILSGCMLQTACGGSGSPAQQNTVHTPPGAYTVTVTGNASGIQQTAEVTLMVE